MLCSQVSMDNDRERRIDAAYLRLVSANNESEKRCANTEMVSEILARSPEQVAKMEQAQGIL